MHRDLEQSIVMLLETRWMMSKNIINLRRFFSSPCESFRWHVDKLEFKANNQPNRFLFYDRSLRRVPTPLEQQLLDYKKELETPV